MAGLIAAPSLAQAGHSVTQQEAGSCAGGPIMNVR